MVNIITYHVGLEFYSVFTSYKLRFLMIIVQEIVNWGLMELSNRSQSPTTDWTATFLWETTFIETNVVNVVFLTFYF